eukprot:21383-Heterococcus_DN1.PRE.2
MAAFILGTVLAVKGADRLTQLIENSSSSSSSLWERLADVALGEVCTAAHRYTGPNGSHRILYAAAVIEASTAADAACSCSLCRSATAAAAAATATPPATVAAATPAAVVVKKSVKVGKLFFKGVHLRYPLKVTAGQRRVVEDFTKAGKHSSVVMRLLAVVEELAYPGRVGGAYVNRVMELLEAIFTQCAVSSIKELGGGAPAYGDAVHFSYSGRVWCGRGGTLRQAHDDAVNELREFKAEHCSSEADYADRVTELTEIVEHCLLLYTQRVIYGYGTKLGVGKSGGGSSAITLNRTVAALS